VSNIGPMLDEIVSDGSRIRETISQCKWKIEIL